MKNVKEAARDKILAVIEFCQARRSQDPEWVDETVLALLQAGELTACKSCGCIESDEHVSEGLCRTCFAEAEPANTSDAQHTAHLISAAGV